METIFACFKTLFGSQIPVSLCECLVIKDLQKQRISFDSHKYAPPFFLPERAEILLQSLHFKLLSIRCFNEHTSRLFLPQSVTKLHPRQWKSSDREISPNKFIDRVRLHFDGLKRAPVSVGASCRIKPRDNGA